ncbi:MAG: heat-inducible transcriptional repressor HrcA [Bacilli bacterium]|nr:heat-inducible transcriptional repressor HrcA [Bacilli bacterium]
MDERKNNLLKEIVEIYIKTVKPVGSKSLCDKFNCSSATIRNEMAILEELGYIEKNHISSGRIPSEAGYRYYVENLMQPEALTGKDMLMLQKIFTNNELNLSDAITKCMEIISEITNYASVVLGKNSEDNTLLQVNIIALSTTQVVAVVCTDKGNVENKTFTLPPDTDMKELIKTSEIINKMLVGTPITKVGERLELEIKPIIKKNVYQYETIYNIFYDALSDFASRGDNIHISGRAKIFEQPEYNNAEEMKRLAGKLEDMAFIKKVEHPADASDEVKIYIGEETEFDPNVTIIRKKYKFDGEEGTIAVIGPKRMDYGRIVGLLNYVDDAIDSRKGE